MSSSFNIRPGDRPGQNMITQGGGQAGAYGGPINFYDDGAAQAQLLARRNNASQQAVANIGQTGARNQQNRFNQVFPWMKQQFGSFMGQNGGAGGAGGAGFPATNVSTNPIYSNSQIQQQVNSGIGQNNAQLAGQQQAMGNQMAARGFGGGSPLAAALGTQMGMANNAANQQVGTQLPFQFAKDNAQHVLGGQQLAEQQRASLSNEQTERQKALMSPLLQLLGSFNFNA